MSENSTHTQSHIDSIAKQEHEFPEQRTLSEHMSDRVAGFAGSMFFVLLHILLVVLGSDKRQPGLLDSTI